MMSILTSTQSRENSEIEGFGWRSDSDYYCTTADSFFGGPTDTWSAAATKPHVSKSYGGTLGGSANTVSFKQLFELFNQSKEIPLMWGGLVLEFELPGGSLDSIIDPSAGTAFQVADTSNAWQIEGVRAIGDVCTLDSALQNSYAEHVLSGRSLPINYNTYITMQQGVTGSQLSANISRSVSK